MFYVGNEESHGSLDPIGLYVEIYVVCDMSGLVGCVVNIPYLLWFLQGSFPQFHSSYEGFAHEAIGCSRVYKCFDVSHCIASSDRDGNVHGLESHSHYYRIELMNRPYPG